MFRSFATMPPVGCVSCLGAACPLRNLETYPALGCDSLRTGSLIRPIFLETNSHSNHDSTPQPGSTVGNLMPAYYIGVDVGTGSARAALVRRDGTLVASSTYDIPTWRDEGDHRIFEQSTTATWGAVCNTVKQVVAESKVDPSDVKGLGFDATCSLAVTDMGGTPICVTSGKDLGLEGERNIILWADHRAENEAGLINSTGSVVLDYVGGVMSVRTLLACTR